MQKIYVATEEQLKTLLNDIFKDILSDKPEDQNNSQLGDYIEEKEAIQLVGRKTTWFYNMRVSEKLPYTKIGSKIFYSKADLLQILDNNKK